MCWSQLTSTALLWTESIGFIHIVSVQSCCNTVFLQISFETSCTVECRYNVVWYNIILYSALQWLVYNLIRGWTHKRHPIPCTHISLLWCGGVDCDLRKIRCQRTLLMINLHQILQCHMPLPGLNRLSKYVPNCSVALLLWSQFSLKYLLKTLYNSSNRA